MMSNAEAYEDGRTEALATGNDDCPDHDDLVRSFLDHTVDETEEQAHHYARGFLAAWYLARSGRYAELRVLWVLAPTEDDRADVVRTAASEGFDVVQGKR